MKKILLTISTIFLLYTLSYSQLDCSNFISNRKAEPPYKMSSLSKSAVSISGHTYKYEVPLSADKEYRIIFFASPAFNNNIHFKIIDTKGTSNPADDKVIIDLPGENPQTNNARGTAALASYTDPKTGQEIHPYFDIYPQSATQLEIIIEVGDAPPQKDEYGNTYTEIIKGCIAVVILEKPMEQ